MLQKYLVPFTGGVNSLHSLIWTLQQNVKPHLFYVTNLFPQNGHLELESIKMFVQNLRDYWHEPLQTREESACRWNITIFTVPPNELPQLIDDRARFAYLAGVCVQVARQIGAAAIVSQQSPAYEVDRLAMQTRTGIKHLAPGTSVESLDYLYAFYSDTLNGHEDQHLFDDQDPNFEAYHDPWDSSENKACGERFLGHFDEEFPFWQTIQCCEQPSPSQHIVQDDELPRLCNKCSRCRQVRYYICHNVDSFMKPVVSPESSVVSSDEPIDMDIDTTVDENQDPIEDGDGQPAPKKQRQ